MTNGILMGNAQNISVVSLSIDVASVAANTSAEQDCTLTGLKVNDVVFVNKPSLSAGLGVTNARVKAANTLSLTFTNSTGGAINPAAETYLITVVRPASQVPATRIGD